MPSSPEPIADGNANAPDDSGLRCPHCEYNLTGLTENRCPECGGAFDPEELRRFLSGVPMPVPEWEGDRRRSLIVRFLRTCWMTWCAPTRFANTFPWAYDPHSAMSFWVLARAVAVAIIFAGAMASFAARPAPAPPGRPDLPQYLVVAGAISLAVVVASIVCEVVLMTVLRLCVRQRFRPQLPAALPGSVTASASWWGLIAYNSSFTIWTSAAASLAIFVGSLMDSEPATTLAFPAIGIVPVFWWAACLGIGVQARAMPGPGVIVVRVLIFVVGFAFLFAPIGCLP